ncbi:hypothetical protein MCBMB27_02627 [Methylobacterium phyllosphaerae]|uniref:Uncharacterized protein n=1 Tax=Methylobacterium phyllosphaerae TaxID=418223 RepID=A0AAE8HSI5_9HYPH|nr:hypothetical protein [Methylobacterium phyllosphaerae]APT31918.1 hypothetical protein MCBMB27_02627 [Methylobacterium phyllosphaerae]SFH01588.1 hypothetical protein SAMN05192567_11240 [Methylobacterium phyllosphaerae]
MGAHVMILPPMNPEIRAGGLPIRLLAEDAIRRAKAAMAKHAAPAPVPAAPVEPPELPPTEEVAEPPPTITPLTVVAVVAVAAPVVPVVALERTLRGFTILDLYVEARRTAIDLAIEAEHLEGLAAGRTYGDRSLLPGFTTPESYRIAAFEAKRRAEMAGATADFLRGMLGHEGALTDLLSGRSDV